MPNFISGVKAYPKEKGYSNFTITDATVTFSNMETEVANNRPALIGLTGYGYTSTNLAGHIVTLVGTEKYQETTENNKWYYNLVIRDGKDNTPMNVWISYGRGGGTILNVVTVKP